LTENVLIAVIGSFTVLLIAVVGFFLQRERELGALQASKKALHKRIDRIEKSLNGEALE